MVKRFLILSMMTAIFLSNGCKPQPSVTDEELQTVLTQLSDEFTRISPRVVRPAEGFLKYPYLIPAGFYQQMWDWDGGYVAGCMTTEGPRVKRGTFFMKPFLSQGVLRASQAMGDFEWVRPYYERLCRVLAYRDATQRDEATGLYFWEMDFQSGADNNPALNYFSDDRRSFLACDCSAMQLLEFRAQAEIANALGLKEEAKTWNARAEALAGAIQHLLWCAEDQCYYNVDRETGDFYRRVSYSSFWPLYAGLAPEADGQAMIRRYLLSGQHMRSPHGLRSLSASDPDYNNKNIILPFSNWQGPIWIPALVVYAGGMLNYGFKEELRPIAVQTARLLLKDLDTFDTMHENYHAETGEGLAPAPDYVDADGRFIGFISWNLCAESVLRSCR